MVVTDRGKPVARLLGLEGEAAQQAQWERLVGAGLARPPVRRLGRGFLDLPRPRDPDGRSLGAVLEERGEGR